MYQQNVRPIYSLSCSANKQFIVGRDLPTEIGLDQQILKIFVSLQPIVVRNSSVNSVWVNQSIPINLKCLA